MPTALKWILPALCILVWWSCAAAPPAPDYRDASAWVCQTAAPDKPVDLFYVHPTIYAGSHPANMDIRDPQLRATARHLIDTQASVYADSTNLFAPYYRQMSMARLDPAGNLYQNPAYRIGAGDVARAFTYYLTHLNGGRPFVLAGHSQGSMTLISLMREQFDNPEISRRLVAAYIIGYSVTREDVATYPWMRPARGAEDTGVIISYNTQAPETIGSPVLLPGAVCINPLNWKTDATPAGAALNRGAVFFHATQATIEREVPGYAGACIDTATGALVTELPEQLDTGSFPPGVYHIYDYALWYRNLQANVARRCRRYLARQTSTAPNRQ